MPPLSPIRVRRYGPDAPGPVAVLHGGPGAPGYLAPLARALATEFSILEPLQRESGTVPLTVARHVDDLAAVLDRPAVLLGHSWGAMLALSFAVRHPGRVIALLLVGCGTYDADSRAVFAEAMRERLEGLDPPEEFAAWARVATRAQAHDPIPRRDEVVAYDPDGSRETWADVERLQAEGVEPAAFAAIRAPACMVHGADDPHPGRATHATLRRHVPHLEYLELPRCGHEPWSERHARGPFEVFVRRRLRTWLAA